MKTIVFAIAISFIAISFVFAQSTGFILTDSAKVVATSATLSDTSVSGKAYRFDLFGFYSGPDSLSSHAIWAKSYTQRSIPTKIVVDMMSPSYTAGVTRIAIGLDTLLSGSIRGIANSGFIYIYPGSGWVTKTFTIYSTPGATLFKRLGFSFSLIQGEIGYRAVFIDNVRLVSAAGDTVMLDDGSGVINVPPAPTPSVPTNNATNIALPVTFQWNASSGAAKYWLRATNASGGIVWSDSMLTSTSVTAPVGIFQNNTLYYWRVRAGNSSGWSDWSTTRNFTTTTGAPTVAPILGSPLDGATNQLTNVPLSCGSVALATSYQFQVSTVPTFVTTVFDQSVAGLSIAPTGLSCGNVYYWRARAANSVGNGPWSSSWSFTTVVCVPWVPTLVSPANGATGVSTNPTPSWDASSGAVSYRLQVMDSTGYLVFDRGGITTTSCQVSNLKQNFTYWWRVNASSATVTSDWSLVWWFRTLQNVPKIVVLSYPPNNSTGLNLSPTLRWNSVVCDFYDVQVATSSSFTYIVFERTGVVNTWITACNLSHGTTYYWRVRAVNQAGAGPWSEPVWNFMTIGLTSVGPNEIPKEFSLSQNFPNPFNPVTTINFELPKNSPVILKVYDVLGREIATLIDEENPAGKHQIIFNGSNLPSGIYLYKLIAGKFVETKKMILMK